MMLGCILKQSFGLEDSITVGCVQDTKDIEVSEDTASQLGINQKQVFVTFEEILDTMKDCMYTDDHFLRGKNITTTFDLVYYLTFKLCLQKVNVEIENTDLVQGDGADTLLGSISVFMYKDVPVVIRKFPHLEIDKDRAKTIIKQKFYRDKIDPNNTKHKGSGQLFVELSEELGANAIMAFKHPDILRWVNDLEYKFSRPDIKLFPKKVIEYLGYDPIKVDRTIMEQGTGIYDIMKIVLELMASSSQSGKSPNSAVKELVNIKEDRLKLFEDELEKLNGILVNNDRAIQEMEEVTFEIGRLKGTKGEDQRAIKEAIQDLDEWTDKVKLYNKR
jgi:hypothetical protein